MKLLQSFLLASSSCMMVGAFIAPAPSARAVVPTTTASMAASPAVDAIPEPVAATGSKEVRSQVKKALLAALGENEELDPVLVCPSSLRPLKTKTRLVGPFGSVSYKECPQFGTKYTTNDVYTDLTPADSSKSRPFWRLSPREVGTQELFRSPVTSFLYERGWRQNFNNAGFPGIDKEFEEFMRFLGLSPIATTVPEMGVIVDMSCGSGLMTRRMVQSGAFQRVIGADYSESMLQETALRFRSNGLETPELVRADAARMPFQSDSLDAMHAGAALHCWPKLEESLREVHRVLKPGGKFFATTFEVRGTMRSSSFKFFQIDELKNLLVTAGFDPDKVEVRREGVGCLIAKCEK